MKGLTVGTKLMYGFGFSAKGIKDGLFQLFLFFYFSQVLGLDQALAGLTTFIALLFDAFSDPVVGMLSDKWKSKKWGRRHPFMFFSAIPLGLFTYLLFLPPSGLGQMGLFWWLTIFTILVRLCLTLYLVPGMSLGAELTTDYEERTSVTSYRIMFAAFLPAVIIIYGLLNFFTPTETISNGMLNAEAYPRFALLCGVLMMVTILVSTWGTRHTIPNLPQANESEQRASLGEILAKFRSALKLKSYRSLVLFIMTIYIAIGVGTIFVPYFITYYFGWSEKEMALLPIASGVAGFLSVFVTPIMGRKFDKRKTAIISTVLLAFFFSLAYNLRILGFFPENGSPNLLPIFIVFTLFGYLFIFVTLSMANSMMADVVDDYDLSNNKREEGLFFSTMSFAYKCTVGLGYLVAGLILKAIAFPKQVELKDVSAEKLEWLGLIGGPILFLMYVSAIYFIISYPITKERYTEIRNGLELRDAK